MSAPTLPICEEPGCGQVFESTRALASHQKAHARPVACPECGDLVKYLFPHLRSKHDIQTQDDATVLALQAAIKEYRRLLELVEQFERGLESLLSRADIPEFSNEGISKSDIRSAFSRV